MTAIYILFAFAAVFSFFNGFHDSSNIVATIISSRAMNARLALLLTALAELAGAIVFGLTSAAVARTIGKDIFPTASIRVEALIAGLAAAILWSIITWLIGIPSSSSHTLIGGLVGAVVAESGFGVWVSLPWSRFYWHCSSPLLSVSWWGISSPG